MTDFTEAVFIEMKVVAVPLGIEFAAFASHIFCVFWIYIYFLIYIHFVVQIFRSR